MGEQGGWRSLCFVFVLWIREALLFARLSCLAARTDSHKSHKMHDLWRRVVFSFSRMYVSSSAY